LLAGDSAGVIADLKARLAQNPDDELAWLQLGTVYLHIAHHADAVGALARAVELDGTLLEARRLYAQALSRLRRYDEAAFQLVQAKRLAPTDARVLKELGIAFYDKRLYDKAKAELGRARELAPEDARTHYALGLAHEAKGEMADAIACYREAVRLEPGLVDARLTLADALAQLGEMGRAVSELEDALQIDRTNTQIALNLEALRQGLAALEAARLLGKHEEALLGSALVQRGALHKHEDGRLRYHNQLCELWVDLDGAGTIERLTLLFADPERAARTPDSDFRVEVLNHDGSHAAVDYATAATLTFLREAVGCTMSVASELYARLLRGEAQVVMGGARVRFDHVEHATRHGIAVERVGWTERSGRERVTA
jgi:cytochrome c-type biogenesis protein CcmH/NrfG